MWRFLSCYLAAIFTFMCCFSHTEVLAEEAAVRRKADEVRAKKEQIEMARGITLEDLTKGLLNYRYTGLNFVQGEKGALE